MASSRIGNSPQSTSYASTLGFAAIIIAMLVAAVDRLQFVHNSILPFLQRAGDPGLYGLSYGINRSVVPTATPVFSWLSAVRLDLATPAFTVPLYVLGTAFGGLMTWKLLRDIAGVKDPLVCLAVVFATGFAMEKFLQFSLAGWISQHNFTFTFLASALRLLFLYALLQRRFRLAAAMLLPICLLTFKIGWPLFGFLSLVMLIERRLDPVAWGLIALALVNPAMTALNGHVLAPQHEAAALFEALRAKHTSEDNPFAGPIYSYPVFAAAMLMGWYLAGKLLEGPQARIVRIIIGATVGVLVVTGIYIQGNGLGHPIAAVILLSPARASEAAVYLCYMLLLVWIVRTPWFTHIEKAGLLLAAIVMKVQPGGMLMAGALAIMAAVALASFVRHRLPALDNLARRFDAVPLGAWLALPCLAVAAMLLKDPSRTMHVAYDRELGLYDYRTPPSALPMLRAIKAEPGDRLIQFVREDDPYDLGTKWNYLTRKSPLEYDYYYLSTLPEVRQQMQLSAIARRASEEALSSRVSEQTHADFARLGASLVIHRKYLGNVPGWSVVRQYGEWLELRP